MRDFRTPKNIATINRSPLTVSRLEKFYQPGRRANELKTLTVEFADRNDVLIRRANLFKNKINSNKFKFNNQPVLSPRQKNTPALSFAISSFLIFAQQSATNRNSKGTLSAARFSSGSPRDHQLVQKKIKEGSAKINKSKVSNVVINLSQIWAHNQE